MKICSKILAVIICLTLAFSVSTLFFSISAEENDTPETAVGENAENTEKEENKDDFLEAFASMFKNFHPMSFVENLRFMGIGMLGIFIIIGIIITATVIINKLFSGGEKKKEN